ncbi:MAG: hypothetical protein RIR11_1445 [Bacteroidota bacterium]|jgi:hypothetical protein
MNSNTLKCCALLICTSLFFACKKDNNTPTEESPFFSFFEQTSIIIDTTPVATNTWQYGFTFSPQKNGKIEQLGIKLPVTGGFVVRLWDLKGLVPILLTTQDIVSAQQHTPAFVDITPIDAPKDAKFGVSVTANSFYRLTKNDGSKFTFPLVVGNIKIESFNETIKVGADISFPNAVNDTRVAPCVNVVFVAD